MSEPLVQLRRSPYINRPIDNTAFEAYSQCDWKYYASMVLNRTQRIGEGETKRGALGAGDAWHKIMEVHYKTGGDQEMARLALQSCGDFTNGPDDFRTPERLWQVYQGYLRYWGDHETDARNNGKTVGFPHNPLVEIPLEIGWEGATEEEQRLGLDYHASIHPYTGKIDRIIEWQGLYYVEDHKTTTQPGGDGPQFSATYWAQWNPANQMMGYAWLAQKFTGLPIAGVRINGIGWLKSKTKYDRHIISISQPRLTEWAENNNHRIKRLEEAHGAVSSGVPPDEAFPRTWRCSQKYGMCQYREVCSIAANRRMQVLEQEFAVKAWNPLEAHGEGEIE